MVIIKPMGLVPKRKVPHTEFYFQSLIREVDRGRLDLG